MITTYVAVVIFLAILLCLGTFFSVVENNFELPKTDEDAALSVSAFFVGLLGIALWPLLLAAFILIVIGYILIMIFRAIKYFVHMMVKTLKHYFPLKLSEKFSNTEPYC